MVRWIAFAIKVEPVTSKTKVVNLADFGRRAACGWAATIEHYNIHKPACRARAALERMINAHACVCLRRNGLRNEHTHMRRTQPPLTHPACFSGDPEYGVKGAASPSIRLPTIRRSRIQKKWKNTNQVTLSSKHYRKLPIPKDRPGWAMEYS